LLRGLYSGGTLCAEAQIVLQQHQLSVTSNAPVPGAKPFVSNSAGNLLIDLGDDEYTRGRPHPMIEPAVRDAPLIEALRDERIAVILLDVVLGYGGHDDPAGHLVGTLRKHRKPNGPAIVASVTGTAGDPQNLTGQIAKLVDVGISVCPSNADAAELAASILKS
jgi:FdrA protein